MQENKDISGHLFFFKDSWNCVWLFVFNLLKKGQDFFFKECCIAMIVYVCVILCKYEACVATRLSCESESLYFKSCLCHKPTFGGLRQLFFLVPALTLSNMERILPAYFTGWFKDSHTIMYAKHFTTEKHDANAKED